MATVITLISIIIKSLNNNRSIRSRDKRSATMN